MRNILNWESKGSDQLVSWMPSFPKLMPKVKQSSVSLKFFHCLEFPSGRIQLTNVSRAGMGNTGRGI